MEFMGMPVTESTKKIKDGVMQVLTVKQSDWKKCLEEKYKLGQDVFDALAEMRNDVTKEAHPILKEIVKKDGKPAELRLGHMASVRMQGKTSSTIPGTDKTSTSYGKLKYNERTGTIEYLKGDSEEYNAISSEIEECSKKWK